MNNLYTIGYTSTRPDELKQIALDKGAFVLDIRHVRFSRAPQWREGALAALLTWGVYKTAPALGNKNYKNGGSIELVNPEAGITLVKVLLESRPVILLCGCFRHETCHRLTVADLVVKAIGCEIEHLYGGRKES